MTFDDICHQKITKNHENLQAKCHHPTLICTGPPDLPMCLMTYHECSWHVTNYFREVIPITYYFPNHVYVKMSQTMQHARLYKFRTKIYASCFQCCERTSHNKPRLKMFVWWVTLQGHTSVISFEVSSAKSNGFMTICNFIDNWQCHMWQTSPVTFKVIYL